MKHWILIADASGARAVTFSAPHAPPVLAAEFPNPRGRKRTQELDADLPGRVAKAGALGTRSAVQQHTNAHEAAALDFARELASTLRKELDKGSYQSISLVSPPHFLGVLRAELDKKVRDALQGTLDRDLVHVPVHELQPHVETLLTQAAAK
jgi:protein required for attachment to host cells